MSNPGIASRFDEIYNSTQKSVLAFVTAKCRHTADIGDIVQETYMELYKLLCKRGADYVTNEKALVLKIAKQKLSRHYKLSHRLRIFVSMTAENEDEEILALSDFEFEGFLMEDFAVNNLLLAHVQQFLKGKPEDVKKVFYLFYEIGFSIPEIADILEISQSSVKNKLYRTIGELRNLLNE